MHALSRTKDSTTAGHGGDKPRFKLVGQPPEQGGMKRLNVNLTVDEHDRLKELAEAHGISMSQLVRWALDIVEDGLAGHRKGQRLVAVDGRGRPIKQYLLGP